jgi:PucR-like helix-turn-helix protein/diguanylate cyclase with GGDEF domain
MKQVNGNGQTRAAESLAVRVLARVAALTDVLVRTIEDQNPGYRTVGVVPQDDLWRSCHDNLTRVLELIAEGSRGLPPETDGRYDAARATGRRRAEQRMPLDDVLRSFRLGGRLVWESLIDQAHVDNSVDTDGLLDVATRVWEVVDTTSAQVAAAYHSTESNLVRTDEQRRAALWEGLLHGRAKDLAFAYEASRIIGIPVEGPCAAVVADIGPATQWERRLAADRIGSAWQVRANTLVGLLTLRQPTVDTAVAALRDVLDVPAGVSLVVRGLAEVDVAYRQAMLARRTLPAGRNDIAVLAERLPEALLLSAPELAEQLVHRWLGDLLAVPAAERRLLLGTLQIWVATGGSIRHTAEAACCHRNTVINRLQRMQAITGHDFADPACQVELALALRASALLAGPQAE